MRIVTATLLGTLLIVGLSACKPGVYYPFGDTSTDKNYNSNTTYLSS